MILVDIQVPIMEQVFDFTVDEHARIGDLIVELSEIICQRARWPKPENTNGLLLCSVDGNNVLPEDGTLAGMGISSGARLMLV
ncbi:MAG: hypothetical protein II608_01120 [Oscillospiraceae bacterium]|nr:hypothetical protein [Oscillospiraceae bacterium]